MAQLTSFNLVIEYLLISTRASHRPRLLPRPSFQSRNRVSSNFNSESDILTTEEQAGFNLVIEYLLISTLQANPKPARHCIQFQSRNRVSSNFNVVIRRFLAHSDQYQRFNLVIEYLLISTPISRTSPLKAIPFFR